MEYTGEPDRHPRGAHGAGGRGIRVRSFTEEQTDLEDIFMKVTRGAVAG